MSMDVFKVCIDGYKDHLLDLQVLGIQQGYWSGYFTRSRRPRPLKEILQKMHNAHTKPETHRVEKPEVDVEAFQKMEEQFNLRRAKYNK